MKHIILVEDDEPIRDAFLMAFADSNYKFTELTNGEKIINNEIDTPDLFILDKSISGTDGLDVCRYIKNSEQYRNVPVIMLSANPEIVKLAKDVGADDAISKPFTLKKVREILASLLQD